MKSKRQPQIGDVYYLHYHGHAKFFLVNNISNFRISGRTFDINGNYFGEQYFLESAKDFFCQVDFLGKVDPYSPEIHDFMNRYIHCEINSSNPFPSDLKQNLILEKFANLQKELDGIKKLILEGEGYEIKFY